MESEIGGIGGLSSIPGVLTTMLYEGFAESHPSKTIANKAATNVVVNILFLLFNNQKINLL